MIRLIALAFLVCFSVNAYSQVPFECDDNFHQVFSDEGSLMSYNVLTNTFVVAPNSLGEGVNAMGYRLADNLAYGIISSTNQLVQMAADGSAVGLGGVTGLPNANYPAGDFASDGLLYVYRGLAPFLNMLFVIDVETVEVVNVINLAGPTFSVADMAFNPVDGLFYGVSSGAVGSDVPALSLVAIDPDAGTIEVIGPTNIPEEDAGFGSMYADGSGRVYGGSTRDLGIFYELNTGTGNGKALGDTFTGDNGGGVDGFFCSANAGPLSRAVPTLSQWGLIAMAGVLGIVGFMVMRRRKLTV